MKVNGSSGPPCLRGPTDLPLFRAACKVERYDLRLSSLIQCRYDIKIRTHKSLIRQPHTWQMSWLLRGCGCIVVKVFASAKYIFDRLTGPRTRTGELHDVRRRLVEQAARGVASPAEEQLALRLRLLREELAARVGQVEACGHCVRPRSASWPGGHCCSGHTQNLFTDHELAALKLSGTTPDQLNPPRTEHAGCAFRGPRGCSLETAHRPCLCISYMCRELQSELDQRGDGPAIARLREELRVGFERFLELRKERLAANHFAELSASLCGCAGHR